MSILDHLKLTANGRLEIPAQWNVEVATALASRDGLQLTLEHWEMLNLMRDYYLAYNISPIKKLLKKDIRAKLEAGESKSDDAYLDALFPGGVLLQGTKIAGLPVPMLDAEIEEMHIGRGQSKSEGAAAPVKSKEQIEFQGKIYPVTAKGNLANPSDWNEQLAKHLAKLEHIQLTTDHWEVIHYLRNFYFSYGITPMVRLLMKHLRQELGETKSSHDYLYHLFPDGPSRQGSRIAGLPEPQGCIDG